MSAQRNGSVTSYVENYRRGAVAWEPESRDPDRHIVDVIRRFTPTDPGRALDLGCGRGRLTVAMAGLGWAATGIDAVQEACDSAAALARSSGVAATYVVADVTEMPAEVGTGFSMLLDAGCFHGLTDSARTAVGRQINSVAMKSATLICVALPPGAPPPLPRGASAAELLAVLPGWSLLDDAVLDTDGLPAQLRDHPPHVLVLRRERN